MHLTTRQTSLMMAVALSIPMLTGASEATSSDHGSCSFSSSIQFREGAPRDRFTIKNTSSDWHIASINLDLSSSAGNLIFDVTADGAGVDVFQPFRSDDGKATLSSQPAVDDGDQTIILRFSSFAPGDHYQFSIDVDDQLSNSELGQIRVSGGEITGAAITLAIVDADGIEHGVSAVFDNSNQATLDNGDC